eukprot:Em0014g831a
MCTECRVTYYCDGEHQHEDWVAIHEKICSMLSVLRSPQPHANSESEREHRKQQQALRRRHIIDVCLQEAHRFLHEGLHQHAIPAALEALKFLTEAYGSAHVEVTPAYLVLAEATIGLNQLREAEQYLSQARWGVVRAPECEPGIKARLHRNLGQLEAAKGDYTEAKKHFAEDIYQSSVAYSPTAIQTSGGYYHMGTVFLKEGNSDCAISLHDQAINIWFTHLSGLLSNLQEQERLKQQSSHIIKTESRSAPPPPPLSVAERAEAIHMLHSLQEMREHSGGVVSSTLYHTLALLHCVLGEADQGLVYAKKALQLAQASPHNKATTSSIEDLIQTLSQTKKIQ